MNKDQSTVFQIFLQLKRTEIEDFLCELLEIGKTFFIWAFIALLPMGFAFLIWAICGKSFNVNNVLKTTYIIIAILWIIFLFLLWILSNIEHAKTIYKNRRLENQYNDKH